MKGNLLNSNIRESIPTPFCPICRNPIRWWSSPEQNRTGLRQHLEAPAISRKSATTTMCSGTVGCDTPRVAPLFREERNGLVGSLLPARQHERPTGPLCDGRVPFGGLRYVHEPCGGMKCRPLRSGPHVLLRCLGVPLHAMRHEWIERDWQATRLVSPVREELALAVGQPVERL